jgi:hypothetical protein
MSPPRRSVKALSAQVDPTVFIIIQSYFGRISPSSKRPWLIEGGASYGHDSCAAKQAKGLHLRHPAAHPHMPKALADNFDVCIDILRSLRCCTTGLGC